MPRVVCTLPNAGHIINGPGGAVRFAPLGDDQGMLSELISDEDAAFFCSIRGYSIHEMKGEPRGSYGARDEKKASVSKVAAPQKETA